MVKGIAETVNDWTEMLGNSSSMVGTCERYLAKIETGDQNAARSLYLLVSPVFFYVHSLYQLQRQAWRTSVTACGIFCERIVRNLMLALDARLNNGIYEKFEDNIFENKNGKVKGELEELGFAEADNLFSLLKILYSARSTTGPHDVPPPEPVQARISVGYCLPIYLRYIQALNHLGEKLASDSGDFSSFIVHSAQLEVLLAFGAGAENEPLRSIIKDRLYRLNFFSQDRTIKDVSEKLAELRHSFSQPLLAHRLKELSTGRDAVLTRTKRDGIYHYRERQDPREYYKLSV